MVDLIIGGFIYFIMFFLGSYFFLLLLLLCIRFFKRIAYGDNDKN